MKLVTWNVQWCRGMDGIVDPQRIAEQARALADFDVLCLQEVARNFPGLPGSRGEDQFALLSEALRGYRGFFAAGVDIDDGRGGRSAFGNALFSRLPVAQVFRHLLPRPTDPAVPSMQRSALEAVVEAAGGPLRVVTTHLEYYSSGQRIAQVHALRALHGEACAQAQAPPAAVDADDAGGPFAPRLRPASALVCGDFNFRPDSIEHALLTSRPDSAARPLLDAWSVRFARAAHPPTFRVHDPECPPYCCDYVFVSADIAARVAVVSVDAVSTASDHQPVLIELRDQSEPPQGWKV
jgi:endonuclease/exonuclease/phosphatase family metal-dependent hydrolase